MKDKTCFFTGHRYMPKNCYLIKRKAKKEIVKLIKKGIIYFGAGGAIGFDTIAAEIVLKLKKRYPYIKLILILPCLNQTRNWSEDAKIKYDYINAKAS